MSVFLVLSSSGVLFYLVLLFHLYRDGRRNRNRVELLHDFEFDRKASTRSSHAGLGVTAQAHRPTLSQKAIWLPVTKFEWKPAMEVAQSNRQQTGVLAAPGGRLNRS